MENTQPTRDSSSIEPAEQFDSSASLANKSFLSQPQQVPTDEDKKRLSGTSASSGLSVITDPLKNHPTFRQRDIDHVIQKAENIVSNSPAAAALVGANSIPPLTPVSGRLSSSVSTPSLGAYHSAGAALATPPPTGSADQKIPFTTASQTNISIKVTEHDDSRQLRPEPLSLPAVEDSLIPRNSLTKSQQTASSPALSTRRRSSTFGAAILKVFSPVKPRFRSNSVGKQLTVNPGDEKSHQSPLRTQLNRISEPTSPSTPQNTQSNQAAPFGSTAASAKPHALDLDASLSQSTNGHFRRQKAKTFSISSSSAAAKAARAIASEHLQTQLELLKGDLDVDRIFMVSENTTQLKNHFHTVKSSIHNLQEADHPFDIPAGSASPVPVDIERINSADVDDIMTMAADTEKRISEAYLTSSPDSIRRSSAKRPSVFAKRPSFFNRRVSLFGVASEPASHPRRSVGCPPDFAARRAETPSSTVSSEFIVDIVPPPIVDVDQIVHIGENDVSKKAVEDVKPITLDVDEVVGIAEQMITSARQSVTRKSIYSRRPTVARKSLRSPDGSVPNDPASILAAVAAAAEASASAAVNSSTKGKLDEAESVQSLAELPVSEPVARGNRYQSVIVTKKESENLKLEDSALPAVEATSRVKVSFDQPESVEITNNNTKPSTENRRFSTASAIGAIAAAAKRRFSRDLLDTSKRTSSSADALQQSPAPMSPSSAAPAPCVNSARNVDVGDVLAVGERSSRQFELKQFTRAEGGSSIVLQDVDRLIKLGDGIQANSTSRPSSPAVARDPDLPDIALKLPVGNEGRFAI